MNLSFIIKLIIFFSIISLLFFSFSLFSTKGTREDQENNSNQKNVSLRELEVYQNYCAGCHGLNGGGNGASVVTLSKLPPDFNNPNSIFKNGKTREGIMKTLNQGIPNSQMPKFDYLPQEEKEKIVQTLLKTLNKERK